MESRRASHRDLYFWHDQSTYYGTSPLDKKESPGLCAGSPKANWDGTHPLLKDFVVPEWGGLQDHPRVQVHLDSFGEWRDNLFPNRSVLRCILQRRSSVSIMERFLTLSELVKGRLWRWEGPAPPEQGKDWFDGALPYAEGLSTREGFLVEKGTVARIE